MDENLELSLGREVSNINLAVINGELALPLDCLDHHLLGELSRLFALNVELEDEGRLFLHDDPHKELETPVIVFPVYRIRVCLDGLFAVLVTLCGRLGFRGGLDPLLEVKLLFLS